MLSRIFLILVCASFAGIVSCRRAGTPVVTNNANSAETQAIDNEPLELNEAEQILEDFKNRQDDFLKRYETLSDEEKYKQISKLPQVSELFDQWKRLAKEHPDTPTAASAYSWLCIDGADEEAMEKMFGEYINSPKLRDVCMSLPYAMPSKKICDRLERAMRHSPHSEVQGAAKLSLAEYLLSVSKMREWVDKTDDALVLTRISESYGPERGPEIRDYIKTIDSDEAPQRAVQLLESVVANHADHEIEFGGSLGEIAKRVLFEMKQLAPGQFAPEIVGNDLEGVEFKLSDYRGRVVLLSFWGDW